MEQNIDQIGTALDILVYGAEIVPTTTQWQFQVRVNKARQLAIQWSDGDWQKAKEQLECKIHQVTPVKHKPCDKSFQNLERQLFHQVVTKASSPRSMFGKKNCSHENCLRWSGLWGGKHHPWVLCGLSGLSLRCWASTLYLGYPRYGPHSEWTGVRHSWYHLECGNAVQ